MFSSVIPVGILPSCLSVEGAVRITGRRSLLPSIRIVISNHCNTVNNKKHKKIKKVSFGTKPQPTGIGKTTRTIVLVTGRLRLGDSPGRSTRSRGCCQGPAARSRTIVLVPKKKPRQRVATEESLLREEPIE